jgi:hypothetical protein
VVRSIILMLLMVVMTCARTAMIVERRVTLVNMSYGKIVPRYTILKTIPTVGTATVRGTQSVIVVVMECYIMRSTRGMTVSHTAKSVTIGTSLLVTAVGKCMTETTDIGLGKVRIYIVITAMMKSLMLLVSMTIIPIDLTSSSMP